MSNLENHIKLVNSRLQELIKNYRTLQKDNELLKEQLSSAKLKEKEYKDTIDSLHQKVNILQAASGQMDEQEQKEFEKRINTYLKEIDKCITMLSE